MRSSRPQRPCCRRRRRCLFEFCFNFNASLRISSNSARFLRNKVQPSCFRSETFRTRECKWFPNRTERKHSGACLQTLPDIRKYWIANFLRIPIVKSHAFPKTPKSRLLRPRIDRFARMRAGPNHRKPTYIIRFITTCQWVKTTY